MRDPNRPALLKFPFVIPFLDCPVCNGWGDYAVVPYSCPERFRPVLQTAVQGPWCLNKHNDLLLDLSRELGVSFSSLHPGNCLLPPFLGSLPAQSDFSWQWMPTTFLVSDRVKKAFEAESIRGATFVKPDQISFAQPTGELAVRSSASSIVHDWWLLVFPSVLNAPQIGKEFYECDTCRRLGNKVLRSASLMECILPDFDIVRYGMFNSVLVSARLKSMISAYAFEDVVCERRLEGFP